MYRLSSQMDQKCCLNQVNLTLLHCKFSTSQNKKSQMKSRNKKKICQAFLFYFRKFGIVIKFQSATTASMIFYSCTLLLSMNYLATIRISRRSFAKKTVIADSTIQSSLQIRSLWETWKRKEPLSIKYIKSTRKKLLNRISCKKNNLQ